jgi:excisionase family DNA binding protein
MQQKIEITFPKELIRELEIFTKDEGITINEFILWSVGEKIGELRNSRGIKNFYQIQSEKLNQKSEQKQNPENSPKTILRASEVATYLKISRTAAYRLIQLKELPAIRFGGSVRVKMEDLENFITNNRS